MLKVAKFGGTSLSDAENMKRAAKIIADDAQIKYVVVSAPGKRNAGDYKVTDMLLKCFDDVVCGRSPDEAFAQIENRFMKLIEELGVKIDLQPIFTDIKNKLGQNASKDYVISRGEFLTAKIFAKLLNWRFVGAEEVIFFDENGFVDQEKTFRSIRNKLSPRPKAVIPGFYGLSLCGNVKTFERGGSDVTGAIISRGVSADVYENWTDVDGVLTCAPDIVRSAKPAKSLSFDEMLALSEYGALVIHRDAIKILRGCDTVMHVRNTFNPKSDGTRVYFSEKPSTDDKKADVCVSGRKGYFSVTLKDIDFSDKNAVIMRFAAIFEDNHIGVEQLLFGVNSLSIIAYDDGLNEQRLCNVLNEVKRACKAQSVSIERHFAIMAMVSSGIAFDMKFLHKLYGVLHRFEVKNVAFSADGAAIKLCLPENRFESCIKNIYRHCRMRTLRVEE